MRSTNLQLKELVGSLKRVSRKNRVKIWEALAEELSRSKRSRAAVNLGQIDRLVKDSQAIAVPGTVLGAGNATKGITIGALKFSDQARAKMEKVGGKCISLLELAEMYPKGTGVRILK